MPDGSLYSIIRYRGQFSTKFQLDAYPYDTQILKLVLEDTVLGVDRLLYIPDKFPSVMLDSGITLPGFTVGKPTMLIGENIYPTNFGDLSEPNQETYSRVILSIPVTRPVVSLSIKLFLPIMLVVLCAALVFFIKPKEVGARIGLGITALLTLVALELSSSAALPDVDYLLMLDKIYLLAYVFVIVAVARAVATSWRGNETKAQKSIARNDRIWFAAVIAAYLAATIGVVWSTVT